MGEAEGYLDVEGGRSGRGRRPGDRYPVRWAAVQQAAALWQFSMAFKALGRAAGMPLVARLSSS
jgi:hypothetical protein